MPESARGRGFTLVELVIVMVVLGILAAIAIPRFTDVRTKALRSTLIYDLRGIAASQEIHHLRNLTYGSSLPAIDAEVSEGVTVDILEADASGWSATATHSGVGTGQCALFYGDASTVAPATTPGVVACDF